MLKWNGEHGLLLNPSMLNMQPSYRAVWRSIVLAENTTVNHTTRTAYDVAVDTSSANSEVVCLYN